MKKRKQMLVKTNRDKIELAELNKTISKKQKEDIRKYNVNIIKETIEQGKGFKSAKKKLNTGKTQMTALLEEDRRIVRC